MPNLFIISSGMVLTAMPVPRDIDLPLPLGEWELKFILVLLFLAHILFVNFMVGGSVLTVFFEILGLKWRRYDTLAHKIANTITVNKSLAVVLGVGPLLAINLAYTLPFYSANAITGYAWFGIIPLVIVAFLLTYLHKYTWDRWTGKDKQFHILIGGFAAFIFVTVPLIFLANINLMLFPDKWASVEGFFSSLGVGNVFPRYFHFITATVAVTALFLAGWFGRKKYPVESELPKFERPELRRTFYRIAFFLTMAQLIFGPVLLFTLPGVGLSLTLFVIITLGATTALIVLYLLQREIRASDKAVGGGYLMVWVVLTILVIFMGTARHLYRDTALAGHTRMMEAATDNFKSIEISAQMRLKAGMDLGTALGAAPSGEKLFRNCAACHAVDRILAGPSLLEVYSLYKDDPDGIVTWARNPGKKRPEFQAMPSFKHLGDTNLKLIAEYIIDTAKVTVEQKTQPEG